MKQAPANADPAALTALGKIALATMQNYDGAVARLGPDVDFLTVAAASTTFTAKDGAGTWKLTMERIDQEDAGPVDDQEREPLDLTADMEIGEPRVTGPDHSEEPLPFADDSRPQVDRRNPPSPDARWDEANMRWIEPSKSLLRDPTSPPRNDGPVDPRYKPRGFA